MPFERRDIDLGNKPDWFLKVSPLGKTPVLLVGDKPIFESAVICEFLDDTLAPRLHPKAPLARAEHRSWIEFGSALLNTIWTFYSAPDEAGLRAAATDIRSRFQKIERALGAGPYFSGQPFSIVDATYGPVFRYFDVFETIGDFGILADLPKVTAWRARLAERSSVQAAVQLDYPKLLLHFLSRRDSALSRRINGEASRT
ncbi:hypothetical protein LMG3431_02620 [Achromobacter pestifer]|uniref:Glutathione S-transferase family protein n=1 Tax=Achromobacter pestifer TaxID=1353889 RepID=A0A6S6Z2Y4_9BURK|nr:hypothetical protein LMG3431_02620 [Achromobacter pestifer]